MSIEPEICMKMLKSYTEKLRETFLCGVNFPFDDAFSGILELEASSVEGEQLQQKYKGRKRKGEKK